MTSRYELPNLGGNVQQDHADGPERPGRQMVVTVEEIIETGVQPG